MPNAPQGCPVKEIDFESIFPYMPVPSAGGGVSMPDGGHHNKGRKLRELASKPGVAFIFRKHALEEMAKDKISSLMIKSMLKRCAVIRVEQHSFEETLVAEGRDVDGNKITAVVVAYEDVIKIKVITVWAAGR